MTVRRTPQAEAILELRRLLTAERVLASHNRTTYRYEPDVVYPPGDTLQELLDERGLTQHELATRTDLPTKHINQLIKGAVALTPETALRLERALGTPAHVWNNLESAYQSHRARQAETERLRHRVGLS